jgi:hypothetical protein
MNTKWQAIVREQKRDVRIATAVKRAMADLETEGTVDSF